MEEEATKSQIHTEENAREAETCRWSSFRTGEKKKREISVGLPVTTVMSQESTETKIYFIHKGEHAVLLLRQRPA